MCLSTWYLGQYFSWHKPKAKFKCLPKIQKLQKNNVSQEMLLEPTGSLYKLTAYFSLC